MTIKTILTKELLFELHIINKQTALDIAKQYNCTSAYVCVLLKANGIKNKSNSYKIGVPNSSSTKFKKGHSPWNLGISVPSPNKGKKFPRGKDHWNYKNGGDKDRRMSDPFYRDWRQTVFTRDNFTCQFCGSVGGELNADHIKPWAIYTDLRYDVDNGRTLCVPCHRITDTYGGKTRKNNDGGTLKSVTLT